LERLLSVRVPRRAVAVFLLAVLAPAAVRAQAVGAPPAWRIDGALAFMRHFPPDLDEGCREYGAAAGVRLHYRAHRLFAIEAGVGAQFSLVDREILDCGGLFNFPLAPGETMVLTGYSGERSNMAIVPDLRLIVTPVSNAGGSLRLIGGTGWYVGRSTPAWLIGGGVRFKTRRSSIVLDIERWNAGIPMKTFRLTGVTAGPEMVELIATDRDWFRFVQYRLGFSFWTR
jgi:hypothetical protein